jgi:hypothetical protein
MLGEEPSYLDQEAGAGRGGLVRQDVAEGDPGAVIDGRVDIVIADAPTPSPIGPAMGAMPAAVGDAAQLLDIQVDQLAGPFPLLRTTAPLVRSVWASRLTP